MPTDQNRAWAREHGFDRECPRGCFFTSSLHGDVCPEHQKMSAPIPGAESLEQENVRLRQELETSRSLAASMRKLADEFARQIDADRKTFMGELLRHQEETAGLNQRVGWLTSAMEAMAKALEETAQRVHSLSPYPTHRDGNTFRECPAPVCVRARIAIASLDAGEGGQ